jgi:hypothetical protein
MPSLDSTWELRFTGFLDWDSHTSASCHQSLRFPFHPNHTNDFIYADFADARYRSKLDMGEFNYWRHLTPPRINYFSISAIFGFRYAQVDERLRLNYTNSDRTSTYYAKTWNRFFGPQVGFDFSAFPHSCFQWGFNLKLGCLGNIARQISKLRDYNNANTLRDFNHHAFNLSAVGEAAPFFIIRPSENFFFRIGYEVFWLSSVAAAPIQLGFDNHSGNVVEFGSDHLYHGGIAGACFEF